MKKWTMTLSASIAFLSSQAIAENWVTVDTSFGLSTAVDQDSIRRGSDGIVYFKADDSEDDVSSAVDCQNRVIHWFKTGTDYRNSKGFPVEPNSPEDAELKYVCANAG